MARPPRPFQPAHDLLPLVNITLIGVEHDPLPLTSDARGSAGPAGFSKFGALGEPKQRLGLASGVRDLVNVDIIHGHVVADVVREVGLRSRLDAAPAAYDIGHRFRLDLPLIVAAVPAVGHTEFLIFAEMSQKR